MSEPNPTSDPRLGGAGLHKNPDCPCSACTSRRRKTEADIVAARERRQELAAIKKATVPEDKIIRPDTAAFVVQDRARAKIAQWVELRAIDPDITQKDAAAQIGVSSNTLRGLIAKATKEGWLRFEDPLSKLEHEVIPKVVANLSKFLDEGDKTVTIETAKGTIFRQYADSKGISEQPVTVLALKIEQPDEMNGGMKVVAGHVVGKPRVIIDASPILQLEEKV